MGVDSQTAGWSRSFNTYLRSKRCVLETTPGARAIATNDQRCCHVTLIPLAEINNDINCRVVEALPRKIKQKNAVDRTGSARPCGGIGRPLEKGTFEGPEMKEGRETKSGEGHMCLSK